MEHFPNCRVVLQLAPDERTVNAIMRDYVQAIWPLLGTLPKECQRALAGEHDAQTLAVTLLRAELHFDGSDEARALLQEFGHAYALAAVRITMLHSKPAVAA